MEGERRGSDMKSSSQREVTRMKSTFHARRMMEQRGDESHIRTIVKGHANLWRDMKEKYTVSAELDRAMK